MSQVGRTAAAAFVSLLGLSALALAHEDDPKIRDRKPPYRGPGYSTGAAGRGGGFTAGGGAAFQASNATLLAWIPLSDFGSPANGNDCWGYTSPSGREYAILGHEEGASFVEITNPSDPKILATIDGPDSLWRGIKVYQHYAYLVSEGGNGIQVVNLANIDSGSVSLVATITTGGTSATHTVALDPVSGYLYRAGGGDEGLRFYSLANPANPVYVGEWADRYVHEAQVKPFTSGPHAGKEIAFACGGFNGGFTSTGLSIVDVTNKANPIHLGQVTWPGAAFSHQCWIAEDGKTIYLNDELDEDGSLPTTTYIIDVTNLSAPVLKGSFTNGNTAIGHNLYVKGNLIYEANYTSGLRVFDATNPLAPFEIAWLDTSPGGDGVSFNGLWSNYPFFDSGVVIGGDMERGLFVMWVGAPLIAFSYPSGQPALLDPAGDTLAVHLAEASPGDYVPGSAKLFYEAGMGVVEVPLADQGGGDFEASFGPTPCGSSVSYYFTAQSTNGVVWVDPPNGGLYQATSALGQTTLFQDNFETSQGWQAGAAGDTATSGIWTRANPVGTDAQPEDDHSSPGTLCFFTGQGFVGGGLGDQDVDNGKTTLLSPNLDLASAGDAIVSYYRWYSNDQGSAPEADTFAVDVSNNGGASWTNVETVGPSGPDVHGGWIQHSFRVADFVAPTSTVRVRFIARDDGSGSIIEAAVDDFLVSEVQCPDCNDNGVSDAQDILSGTSLDLDLEGTPDECQPLSADDGTLSTFLGGTVNFALDASPSHASELYLLLGTLTGTAPGVDLGAVHLPLNQDVYFTFTLVHANDPPLLGTFGVLDPAGAGSAAFVLPAGFTSLIGLKAHHAFVAIHPTTLQVSFASNAIPLVFGF